MLMNLYMMGYLKIIYEVKKRCYNCFVIDMEKNREWYLSSIVVKKIPKTVKDTQEDKKKIKTKGKRIHL